jgi:ADP-ribose pyrophosphatase YjhB (NUDIX family)
LVVVERPTDKNLRSLYKKYGMPMIRHVRWDLRHLDQTFKKAQCSGEGVPVILDPSGMVVMIRHFGSSPNYWKLPMGRIEIGEDIEQGTIREAKEETGLDVELIALPAVHKVLIDFKKSQLERWHFIFKAKIKGGSPIPLKRKEIAEVGFFLPIPRMSNWEKVDKEWIPLAVSDALGD